MKVFPLRSGTRQAFPLLSLLFKIVLEVPKMAFSDFSFPESDNYVTIAGYILHHYQKFPKLNETIQIENYTFKIMQAHNNRIDLVKLILVERLEVRG